MTTDGYGFVWVGTKNGLNRITGYGVMNYAEKSSKLVDNMVNSLCYERKQNAMWVGTLKGITIVDCQSGLMKNLNTERLTFMPFWKCRMEVCSLSASWDSTDIKRGR